MKAPIRDITVQISPRNSLDLPRRRLSVEQESAVDLLLTGQSDREVAAALGVARSTIQRWRHHDPFFQAELNRRRAELWAGNLDRLRALIPRALDSLEKAVDGDPALALTVVKVALAALQAPVGPTDPEEILDQHAKRLRGPTELDQVLIDAGMGPVTASERLAALQDLDHEVD